MKTKTRKAEAAPTKPFGPKSVFDIKNPTLSDMAGTGIWPTNLCHVSDGIHSAHLQLAMIARALRRYPPYDDKLSDAEADGAIEAIEALSDRLKEYVDELQAFYDEEGRAAREKRAQTGVKHD